MGILLCEPNFRNVWIRNESVRAEIGQILHTDTHPHTHTTAAKLVVRIMLFYAFYVTFILHFIDYYKYFIVILMSVFFYIYIIMILHSAMSIDAVGMALYKTK